MRTIIQHIGPLYGEANTGSVFGQPNGSIAIGQGKAPAPSPDPTPITPTVEQIWEINKPTYGNYQYLIRVGGWGALSLSTEATVSSSDYDRYTTQDVGNVSLVGTIASTDSVMKVQIASDEDFNNILAEIAQTAGNYTSIPKLVTNMTVTAGTTYYLRLVLFDSAGNSLNKISNVLTFIGGTYS